MSNAIQNVRVFAGSVDSSSPDFEGLRAPATLTLIERDDEFECRFVFFACTPLALTVRAPRPAGTSIRGTTSDPRGWDVSFVAELRGATVSGSYDQPHDRGTFAMEEV